MYGLGVGWDVFEGVLNRDFSAIFVLLYACTVIHR